MAGREARRVGLFAGLTELEGKKEERYKTKIFFMVGCESNTGGMNLAEAHGYAPMPTAEVMAARMEERERLIATVLDGREAIRFESRHNTFRWTRVLAELNQYWPRLTLEDFDFSLHIPGLGQKLGFYGVGQEEEVHLIVHLRKDS